MSQVSAWPSPLSIRCIATVAVGLGLTALAGCSTVERPPELSAAAEKQALCQACHGADGTSVSVPAPVIAGQQHAYLVAQLTAFRDHSRANPQARDYMWPMAASLSDASIERLAAYFSTQRPPPPTAAGGDTAAGRALYEQGAPERGVPACGSCHGDKGQGLAAFPRLAGQHAGYSAAQLAAFADGSRASLIMGPIVRNLTEEEGRQIAAYLSAL